MELQYVEIKMNRDKKGFWTCQTIENISGSFLGQKVKTNISVKTIGNKCEDQNCYREAIWKHAEKRTKKQEIIKDAFIQSEIKKLLDEKIVDEHGAGGNGNYSRACLDFITDKKLLKKYHSAGNYLMLLDVTRTREYSKGCRYKSSSHSFRWLCGHNESGTMFAHSVPAKISTVHAAIEWIWDGNNTTDRQGDVALRLAVNPPNAGWVNGRISIIDAHNYIGWYCKRGNKMYLQCGRLSHLKEQHPAIDIGTGIREVLIARRSANNTSSAD